MKLRRLIDFEADNLHLINSSRYNGYPFWDALRVAFFMNGLKNKMPSMKSQRVVRLPQIRSFVRSLVFLFRKYDMVLFTSDSEKKMHDGVLYDKLVSGIVECYPTSNILIVDFTTGTVGDALGYRCVVNGFFINLMAKIGAYFKKRSVFNHEGNVLLEKLAGIDEFDYARYMRTIGSVANVYAYLFKRWQPRYAIFTCYSYYSAVHAANLLGIKTYELQHGIISNGHPAYYSEVFSSTTYRCKKLLAFGESIFSFLTSANIYRKQDIVVIGNRYIELIRQNISNRPDGKDEKERISIVVPLDWAVEDDLITFSCEMMALTNDVCFVFCPRGIMKESNMRKLEAWPDRFDIAFNGFQERAVNASICLTIDSTCTLEACALGIPSILFDLDGRATAFFGHVFHQKELVCYVSSAALAVAVINHWPFGSGEEIQDAGTFFFQHNYHDNLISAIQSK